MACLFSYKSNKEDSAVFILPWPLSCKSFPLENELSERKSLKRENEWIKELLVAITRRYFKKREDILVSSLFQTDHSSSSPQDIAHSCCTEGRGQLLIKLK